MASNLEPNSAPVNGHYAGHQQYNPAEPNLSSQAPNHADAVAPASSAFGQQNANVPPSNASTAPTANEGNTSIPKDEVGWYFVEQYYTTLSRNPEKLHLFYSKRSQFVSGVEAEKVSVSVGPRAIADRIKELDIQDCKVRVSNVDSQESYKNIVVQVIGEMSNKAAPHRKFVQTFVLAEQPNGYFVLNDIFRYIDEEEEQPEAEDSVEMSAPVTAEAGTEPVAEPEVKTLPSSDDLQAQERAVREVDKKLEQEVLDKEPEHTEKVSDTATSNGVVGGGEADQPAGAESEPIASDTQEPETAPEAAVAAVEADAAEPEKPKDPDPTPVASPPKTAKAAPVQAPTPEVPAKPAAPKTWANLVAAKSVAAPAVPSSSSSTSPAPSQPRAPAPPPQPQPQPQAAAAPSSTSNSPPAQQPPQAAGNGWQTAGHEHAKRQPRPQPTAGAGENGIVLGYVKNVTDKVDASILKSTLQQYGKLAYFDVSRQKNCAFVEFADAAGYNAAVAANPHLIGGEQIYVEERRPRSNAYGGYNAGRGGMRGGRGGSEGRTPNQGRGGFPKDGGRGGYGTRGRGGNVPPRGRGQPQAA